MLKILFPRQTLAILGVHAFGEGATEIVHIGQAVMALGGTIESQDPALAAALLRLALMPTPAHHRAVADEYRRLQVLDAAFDHLSAATRLNPQDAAAYDARARIWRDWGYPQLGMADSARAVFYAPRSAAAHNTRGTLLAAAGLKEDALREFEAALALDPEAAFAQINKCRLVAC